MKKFNVGVQLYSLRDMMEKDVEATLKAVSEIGYKYVEFAGYFGKTAEEMRELLDRYGLKAISVHQGYDVFLTDAKKNIDYLKGLGVKYCVIPWMDVSQHAGHPKFEQTVEEIKKVGKELKENGIQLGYHNHDFEFDKFQNKNLIDWLYETVPADILETEFDCGWVTYAGENPAEYIRKYADRTHIVHLKDFTCKRFKSGPAYQLIDDDGNPMDVETDSREDNGFEYRPVGQGKMNVPEILKACDEVGVEYLIVEQDDFTNIEPLEAVKQSFEYLKSLGV